MTHRDAISQVRSRHRLLNSDNSITDRVINRELKNSAKLLIKRNLDKRKLWATDTIFTTIPCLELEPVPLAECCEYSSPKFIGKSKIQLPKISEGIYQYVIKGVYNIEGTIKLIETTPNRYINTLKLPVQTKSVYFWIFNKYLYVTDPEIKYLRISAFFEDDVPSELLLPNCPCDNKKVTICVNPLDHEFKCPGYLEKEVVELTSQTLMSTYFRTPNDHTSDSKDDQVNKN